MGFETLLSPGRIGSLELRNRILMAPMGSNMAQTDGHCGERIQAYYEARARGGAGALVLGVAAIAWPEGACNPNQVAISGDEFLPGLSALATRVKQHGCRAIVQLQHAGKVAVCDMAAGRPMLVPSVPQSTPDDMMSALTGEEMAAFVKSFSEGTRIEYKVADKSDIEWLIQCFADAAERAQRAGFDGVELHAGHGYILSEFLSPSVNQREDEYGGCLANRARLLVEVIQAVKSRVGETFAVWCRLDSKEYRVENGIVYEDAVATAQMAEQAGADAIHVSAYANPASGIGFTEAPLVHEPGAYLGFARGIKQAVSIPVIAVGRIEPELAERVLAAGDADFVSMGRKLLADPELPNKLRQGRPELVRPCIYCYTCVSQIFLNDHVVCAVNAETGFEENISITPAAQPRRVLVVGGGPAGMETARVAALRGHEVILCEREGRLGGTVFFSSIPYPPNGRLIDYLVAELEQLPLSIRLNTQVDEALIEQISPDAVVLASGALRAAPPVPGAGQDNVFSGDELRALMTGQGAAAVAAKLNPLQRLLMWCGALLGITRNAALIRRFSYWWMPVGRRVAIIGGGLVGVELAEFLAERGRQVTVIEEGEKFGSELSVVRRWRVLHELREQAVVMINKTRLNSIAAKVLTLASGDAEVDIEADTVILASGAQSNRGLAEALQARGIETHLTGDCDGPGYIHGAMHDGHRIGCRL
ncbi:MAG: FAD-dependent oxidoreductase [Halieaceae bacterium]